MNLVYSGEKETGSLFYTCITNIMRFVLLIHLLQSNLLTFPEPFCVAALLHPSANVSALKSLFSLHWEQNRTTFFSSRISNKECNFGYTQIFKKITFIFIKWNLFFKKLIWCFYLKYFYFYLEKKKPKTNPEPNKAKQKYPTKQTKNKKPKPTTKPLKFSTLNFV